ncbi:MAG: dihydroxyacetone kinase subunit DhaK [Burkholderiales bacterium]|nr:dihydroxyacetone kinase subunit DhaK [Burkholderiales bacterium]
MHKKLINHPEHYVDEALDGLTAAFPNYRRIGRRGRVITRAGEPLPGKVGVVTGGGFGHLPLFAGYVGDGLLSACAVGEVFAGPPVDICVETIQAADAGSGVLCILGNYGGDRMSFAQACDEATDHGVPTRTVIVADDVSSAPPEERQKRRGVAGMTFAFKIAGARAVQGAPLEAVADVASRAAQRTRSIGVALSPCLIPGSAAPGFTLGDEEMELGMGIHGEPGVGRTALANADAVVDAMIDRLIADAERLASDGVAVLVNSLGATPLEELLIVYRRTAQILDRAGLVIRRRFVGHFATSMEMAGCSVSILYLDRALETLLDAPARCPFWPTAC